MTTSRTRTHRKKKITAVTAVLIVGGSGAFAFWSSMGAGTGAVSTGTSTPFTVTSGLATGGPLTPGGPTQTVPFTVTNPGTGSQNLAGVTVAVAGPAGTTWTEVTGCSASDYTVGTPVVTAGQIASGASVSGTVTVAMNNLSTNQDGCKNVSVPLYFSAR
ncbi:hypothetical protein [Arthrobacter sedimenti]|uniref:hypothetical protein n=1 Tax=Arthrobacter sedimenti TaxID=2694931 RepID=UPI000B3583EB|nr:hypothetical protein [Arthrobacter sedimenti]OUM39949.1 hypothetical protein B8W73_16155 [Arthrobacter agilis]